MLPILFQHTHISKSSFSRSGNWCKIKKKKRWDWTSIAGASWKGSIDPSTLEAPLYYFKCKWVAFGVGSKGGRLPSTTLNVVGFLFIFSSKGMAPSGGTHSGQGSFSHTFRAGTVLSHIQGMDRSLTHWVQKSYWYGRTCCRKNTKKFFLFEKSAE